MKDGAFATLTIVNLKLSDSGRYLCSVSKTGIGSVSTTNSTSLDVQVSPTRGRIEAQTTSDANQVVSEGGIVEVLVKFKVWPDLYTKTWYKVSIDWIDQV